MKRLERLGSIALVFAARRRLRAAELAEEFSVSERTVYRDVRALQRAGFPIEGSAGDGYRVAAGAYLRPLALGEAEAAALIVAAELLSASADPPLRDRLASASMDGRREPELYWLVPDAHAAWEDLRARAPISMAIEERPFGKVFGVRDPTGQPRYLLELSASRPSRVVKTEADRG